MPTKEAKAKLTKEVKTIYLSTSVSDKLKKAATEQGLNQSVYIEQLLRAHFKKEGI